MQRPVAEPVRNEIGVEIFVEAGHIMPVEHLIEIFAH
jgi:hypothetical protein